MSGGIDASQTTTTASSTISLPVTFNHIGTVTVNTTGATLVLSGTITGSDGLTKAGSGILDLTANNGSLGATVDGGTLLVDNTAGSGGTIGDVGVNPSTTLGGTGTVAGITTADATVSPGDSSTVTGILTDTGSAVFDASSTFVETINGATAGTNYSQLQAGGTINLASATLSTTLSSSFTPTAGEQFTIVNNTGTAAITGTFAGLAQGAIVTVSGQEFSISYTGGTNNNSVVLTTLTPTTTTVSPVTTSPVFGESVTLTATVAPTTGSGTPTGTVQFENTINGVTSDLGTPVTLNSSGVATLPTTQLTAGSNQITAVYSGDTTYATSTSATVTVSVAQASSKTTLTASPNPSLAGQNVTFTATVTAVSPGSGTPTGSVTFYSGTTSLANESVIDGVATFNTTTLPTGTNSINAVYSGDTNFTASTSAAVSQVVSVGSTTIALSVSNTNPFGLQAVTFTAFVSVATGSGTPTGTVTFYDSQGDNLGSSTLTNNEATLSVSTIPVGPTSITAVYSGDSNFLGATSAPLAMLIGHPTQLFVNQVYLDVIGVPSGYSAAYWNALINGGYSPKLVATYILQSPQAKVEAVETAYQRLLNRFATSAEVNQALASGIERSPKLYAKIFGSKEFYQTEGGGTIDGFLNALGQDWFGAPLNPTAQARLARELRHGVSRYQVSLSVITSGKGVRAEVNSIFESVLDRPATASEQTRYDSQVSKGIIVPLYATLFASKEFKTKFVNIS